MEDYMLKIENKPDYWDDPISYPEDCYPAKGWTINGKNLEDTQIEVTKEEYARIVTEIRMWVNNVHLELNLGKHFKIKEDK
jgi:hypothetical protein